MKNHNPFPVEITPVISTGHAAKYYGTKYAVRLDGPEGSLILTFTARRTKRNLIKIAQTYGKEIIALMNLANVPEDFEGDITTKKWDLGGGYSIRHTNETLRDLVGRK